MNYLAAGLLCAAAFAALPALADGKATIAAGDARESMQMEIQWANDRMRMDFPSQQQGYMLMRDGKGYMVTEQNGQTLIVDMTMLRGMANAMGDQASMLSADQAQSVESLEATGDRETIAGIDGEVYRIQWTDRSGDSHDDVMVLSDAPLAREMLQAFQRYVETVVGEPDPIGAALLERDLGMLRFGEKFNVIAIAATSPAADTFELPDDAMTMQEMIQQQMNQSAASQ